MIIDDLNELSSSEEKFVNNNSTCYNKSKKTLDENGVMYIGHISIPCTLFNKTNITVVFQKMGRGVANQQ